MQLVLVWSPVNGRHGNRAGTAVPATSEGLANTGFTYQGQLVLNGTPVTGACTFRFDLFDVPVSWISLGTVTNLSAGPGISLSPNPITVTGQISSTLGTSISTAEFDNAAVTSLKIQDAGILALDLSNGAVLNSKLGTNAVTTDKILDGSVSAADLATNAVTSAKITNGAVTSSKIPNDSIFSSHIFSGQVDNTDLANDSVTSGKIATSAVINSKIATNAVTSAKIADGAVTNAKIANNAVTSGKIAGNSIFSSHIFSGQVGNTDLANASVSSYKIASSAVINSKIATNAVTSAKIADGAVTNSKIANSAVTSTKLAPDISVTNTLKIGTPSSAFGAGDIVATDDLIADDEVHAGGGSASLRNFFGAGSLELLGTGRGGILQASVVPGTNGANGGVYIYAGGGVPRGVFDIPSNDAARILLKNSTGSTTINLDGALGNNGFVMDHPLDSTKSIVYTSIEGPEAAAYTRGTVELVNGEAWVPFEEHFTLVVNPDTMTIQVTPYSAASRGLAVVERTGQGSRIKELNGGTGNYKVDYRVEGVSPNPPKDTDGRREDSGRGWVRELQGRWPGVLG